MSSSTSLLDLIGTGQEQKEAVANTLFDAVSQSMIFGMREDTTDLLTWGWYGGRFTKGDGTNVAIVNDVLTLSASTTNYIEADTNGAVTKNTTAFSAGAIPLYTVVTSSTAPTGYTDHRDGTQGNYTVRNGKKRVAASVSTSGAVTIDWSKYDVALVTATGDITFTFSGAVDEQPCILRLISNGHVMTWPASVRWPDDIAVPTFSATKMDRIGFIRNNVDGKYDVAAIIKGY